MLVFAMGFDAPVRFFCGTKIGKMIIFSPDPIWTVHIDNISKNLKLYLDFCYTPKRWCR